MSSRLAALAAGLLLAAVLLLGAELLLRWLGLGDAPHSDPFAGFGSGVAMFERVERPGAPAVYRVSPARLRASDGELRPEDGREFRAERPPGALRIFVVGGSSAAGVPYPSRYAFSAWLERRLRAALPDRHVEVVNAALSGYASRRLLPVVREIAGHDPDLLIVYMGHNEWAERRYYAHLIDMDPRLFRAWDAFVNTHLYRVLSPLLRSGLAPFAEPEPIDLDAAANANQMFAVLRERAAGRDYPTQRDLAYRDLLYEFNLRAMVEAARSAGAPTLLLTLSQNFADWAPGASSHRPDLGEAQGRRWEEEYAEGERLRARGECPAAVVAYERALAIDGEFAELHFRLAGCQRALGNAPAARRHYRLASDLDRVPHGAPTHFNDIVRRVARETGSPVADVSGFLESHSPDGLVGDDLFVDSLHPNLRAHQLIAEVVARALRREGIPAEAHRWRETDIRDPDPALLHARNPELALREVEMRMFTCLLALRDECARDAARWLLARQPDHPLARQALARVEAE